MTIFCKQIWNDVFVGVGGSHQVGLSPPPPPPAGGPNGSGSSMRVWDSMFYTPPRRVTSSPAAAPGLKARIHAALAPHTLDPPILSVRPPAAPLLPPPAAQLPHSSCGGRDVWSCNMRRCRQKWRREGSLLSSKHKYLFVRIRFLLFLLLFVWFWFSLSSFICLFLVLVWHFKDIFHFRF